MEGHNSYSYSSKRYVLDDNFYGQLWQVYRRRVVLQLISKNKTILDVACYDGTYMMMFKEQGNRVYGIEASDEAVKRGRDRGLKIKVGDLEKEWDYSDAMFDVVFMGELIEHIVDTDFVITEAKRVLKSGGSIIITTPNLAAFSKRLLLLWGMNPYQEASFTYPPPAVGHLREFTYDLLKGFMEYHGFKLSHFRTDILSIPYVPGHIQRWLGMAFPSLGRSLIMSFQKV